MRAARWGEAHAREAMRRGYEIAAYFAADDRTDDAQTLAEIIVVEEVDSEQDYRQLLAGSGFDAARIEREVRRVRGLADDPPRLVRETRWRVYFERALGYDGDDRAAAARWRDNHARGAALVRVDRIRRAS